MVEHDLPKVEAGVRFPSLAQGNRTREGVGKRQFPVAEILKPRGFKERMEMSDVRFPSPTQVAQNYCGAKQKIASLNSVIRSSNLI